MIRLKTDIWLKAHMRQCEARGAFVTVARKGNGDAGVVAFKVYAGQHSARLIMQSIDIEGNKVWRDVFAGTQESHLVDERLAREVSVDPDLWIVDIEQCDGAAFLDIVIED